MRQIFKMLGAGIALHSAVLRVPRPLGLALVLGWFLMAGSLLGASSIATQRGKMRQRKRKCGASTADCNKTLQRWATEEVPFIITDEERRQLQELHTCSEREEFINKFWELRNPVLGSSLNKFKEEYYRRLAYAKQHFSYLVKGRMDDRARIYIQFGPPDEMSPVTPAAPPPSSAKKDGLPFPAIVERWKYSAIDGISGEVIVEFDDPAANGAHHVLVDPLSLYRPQPNA